MCWQTRLQLGVGANHVLGHVRRMRARVADAVDALDRVDRDQQLGELPPLRPQPGAVGVDVLAEQRHLAHAVGGELLDLGDELLERPRDLAAAGARDDAVRAVHVAAGGDLDPAVDVAGPLAGQMPGEALELEEALGGQRVAGQELGQLVHLAGPERHVDERVVAEDLILDRLRPAAADPDHRARGSRRLSARASYRCETKRSSAFSRIEQVLNRIRSASSRAGHLGVADRLEHALHVLGVVLVHLTAEGGDVEALHGVIERSRWPATPGSR